VGVAVSRAESKAEAPEIPRGALTIPCTVPASAMPEKLSFVSYSLAPGFLLTFVDIDVLSVRDGRVMVFVAPRDVVTWERL